MLRYGSVFFVALLVLAPILGVAQVKPACPVALIPATDKEVTAAQGKIKIGDPVCPIAQAGINAETGEAKQFLLSRIGDTNTCKVIRVTPQIAIDGVNSAFATCSARFFKEYESRYNTKIRINRASNPRQCEAELCKGNRGCGGYMDHPAPNSNHVQGVAIDVSAPNQRQMMLFAKQNPQFGVCFPFLDHPTFKDDVHMILAGIGGSEPKLYGCQGVTKACDGVTFNPNEIRNVTDVAAPPTTRFADSMREILGMKPAQPATAAQQAYPSQQLATSQSPLSSFGASLATPLVSDSLVTTDTLATTSNSIADRLNALISTTTSTTASATSVPLVINPNDAATIVSHQTSGQTSGTAVIGGGVPQNTFTGSAPSYQNATPATLSRYQSILTSLRTALEMLLAYVRPFARTTNTSPVNEYQTY